jgi:DNA mismatch endonuclease (patch repair protein)
VLRKRPEKAGRLSPPILRSRSEQMALVKHKNTKPELVVRRRVWKAGLRYRLHDKTLPGKPDLVFRRAKLAVFVHGCFWHRHQGCSFTRMPKSNVHFWQTKFDGNIERDAKVIAALKALGWHAEIVWECEVGTDLWLQRIIGKLTAHTN